MPLTVSPFVSLPTAATLPYTYESMPSALPPPVTGVTGASTDAGSKPRYVVSPSGHAAHPDEIVASCEALRAHIFRRREATGAALRGLEDVHVRHVARRVANRRSDDEKAGLQSMLDSFLLMDDDEGQSQGHGQGQQTQSQALQGSSVSS